MDNKIKAAHPGAAPRFLEWGGQNNLMREAQIFFWRPPHFLAWPPIMGGPGQALAPPLWGAKPSPGPPIMGGQES